MAGRTTDFIFPNSMGDGQHIMMTKKGSEDAAGDVEMNRGDGPIVEPGLDEDILMVEMDGGDDEGNEDVEEGGELEVEDDGDLDSL
jgi:hypothetical protein